MAPFGDPNVKLSDSQWKLHTCCSDGLQVQAECLSSQLSGLSYGVNPGAARALQIVRLIHDMFYSAPRAFQPCASDPPVLISSQEANLAREKGFTEARALYEECASKITNAGNHEEDCAWDESEMGDYNNVSTWPGTSRNDRPSPIGRHAIQNNHRGPPDETLESTRSAPPGLGPNGFRPPIRTSGRGPPPSFRQNGMQTSSRGRGPPPGMAHRPQGSNSIRPHLSAPPGIVRNESAHGPQHQRHHQNSNLAFSSSDSMENFSLHLQGTGNNSRPDDEPWNVRGRPTALPGQPPLGSVQNQYSDYEASSGGYGNPHGQRPETLRPPQPPMPMPGLRGRPARGRGPPPGSGYRMPRQTPPSDNSWAFGVDADVPLPRQIHEGHGQAPRPHRNGRNTSAYSRQYYEAAMDGGDDDADRDFWTAWTPNDADNIG